MLHLFFEGNPPYFTLRRVCATWGHAGEAGIVLAQIIRIFATRARRRNQTLVIRLERKQPTTHRLVMPLVLSLGDRQRLQRAFAIFFGKSTTGIG